MNEELKNLKERLFKIQELLDANNVINDDLKTSIKNDLEELDDLVYDFQQEFPTNKSKY